MKPSPIAGVESSRSPPFRLVNTGLKLYLGDAIGSVAVSKTVCWEFESLSRCHMHCQPVVANATQQLRVPRNRS